MALGFGQTTIRTVVGIGKESTRGTAVAATTTLTVSSLALKESNSFDEGADLWAGTSGSPTVRTEIARDVGGELAGLLSFGGGQGLLWEGVFGTVAEGGGSGPTYTHTYTMSSQIALPSYTLREGARDFSTDHHLRIYSGCAVNSVTWDFSKARGLVNWRATILGMALDSDSGGTPGTPTIADRVISSQLTTFSWNSVSYLSKTSSFRLTVNNGLSRQEAQGSLTAVGFVPSARRSTELSVVMMLTTDEIGTLRTALRAGTSSDLSIVLTGPSSQTMTFTVTDAQVTDLSDPANSFGPRPVTVTFKPIDDGTHGGLELVIVNAVALYSG